jgi:hypothetical protein
MRHRPVIISQRLIAICKAQCGSLFRESHLDIVAFNLREKGLKQSLVPINVVSVSLDECVLNDRHLDHPPVLSLPPFFGVLS